jgi:peptidoglycan/xylan/chitin deacetylase (PgdA/CDA1 family)
VVAGAAESLGIARTVEGGVALTFDDGPHPEGTPAVLELLERAGARATFFMVGEQVQRRPQLAREVTQRGHLVAVHAHRHRLQMRMTRSQVQDDVAQAFDALTTATETTPRLHRPPYGIYSPAGLHTAAGQNLKPLLWSKWGRDWRKHTTPERIAARVTRNLHVGDVILLHDADFYSAPGSHHRTLEALELIIKELKQREIGTVLPV